LRRVLEPAALVLRRDSPARLLEGLTEQAPEVIGQIADLVPVEENGITYLADPARGQKTGWYFDQRENRAFMAALSQSRRVLDLYTHSGGFALAAARAGAEQVLGIDSAERPLELAREAARRSGLGPRCAFERADVFAWLEQSREQAAFGVVVCDP